MKHKLEHLYYQSYSSNSAWGYLKSAKSSFKSLSFKTCGYFQRSNAEAAGEGVTAVQKGGKVKSLLDRKLSPEGSGGRCPRTHDFSRRPRSRIFFPLFAQVKPPRLCCSCGPWSTTDVIKHGSDSLGNSRENGTLFATTENPENWRNYETSCVRCTFSKYWSAIFCFEQVILEVMKFVSLFKIAEKCWNLEEIMKNLK